MSAMRPELAGNGPGSRAKMALRARSSDRPHRQCQHAPLQRGLPLDERVPPSALPERPRTGGSPCMAGGKRPSPMAGKGGCAFRCFRQGQDGHRVGQHKVVEDRHRMAGATHRDPKSEQAAKRRNPPFR